MTEHFTYLIAGGGLAGASAVAGIREHDPNGTILLVSAESHLPYDRPPLSKQLWSGKKTRAQVFLHSADFYSGQQVNLALGRRISRIDADKKTVYTSQGDTYTFDKLLLATGGEPRKLAIAGGDSPDLIYFRTLDDYDRARSLAGPGATAIVIGGGFIGSEIAAALNTANVDVTMIFPAATICDRVFPTDFGHDIERRYKARGIRIIHDSASSISSSGSRFRVHGQTGQSANADFVIIGIGIAPSLELARDAGLSIADGIVVDEHLRTSHPDIYAAGDNALFPYAALGRAMRVEHWDNAMTQGRLAGANMAGANEPYSHMPYFFSDLFELGYEAVGDVSSALETAAEWKIEHEVGILYYLKDGRIRGVMMCNVWGKVDAARTLVRNKEMLRSKRVHETVTID